VLHVIIIFVVIMEINILRANNGDCIHICFQGTDGKEKNILLDGGKKQTYIFLNEKKKKEDGPLKLLIENFKTAGKIFDLVILTHIDEDHIGGFINWLESDTYAFEMIGEVWFNSGRTIREWLEKGSKVPEIVLDLSASNLTSVPQGVQFEDYLLKHNLWKQELLVAPKVMEFSGLKFTLLSPDKPRLEDLLKLWKAERPDSLTSKKNDHDIPLKVLHEANMTVDEEKWKEDDAVPNGSSLAFILSHQNKDFLFLGDAFPSVVVKTLEDLEYSAENPLDVKIVKVAHHGAESNTSVKLFQMLKSEDFIISTNSKQDNHPHKQLLARLIHCHPKSNIHFNYGELIERIFTKQDRADFPYFKPEKIEAPFKF
jgi:hypothetical protein